MSTMSASVHASRSSLAARSALGWTSERRARQAARTRLQRPWLHATGPKSAAGKARVAMNALRHGWRSRAWMAKAQRIRNAIRLCADTALLARMLIRERDRPSAGMADAPAQNGEQRVTELQLSSLPNPPCSWRDRPAAGGLSASSGSRSRRTSSPCRGTAANHPFPRLR